MDNIRKEISTLIDNLENKNSPNRELDMFKFMLIYNILETKTCLELAATRKLLVRMGRSKSKKRGLYSKFNNMSKFF